MLLTSAILQELRLMGENLSMAPLPRFDAACNVHHLLIGGCIV